MSRHDAEESSKGIAMIGPGFVRMRRLQAPFGPAMIAQYAVAAVSVAAFAALLIVSGCIARALLTPVDLSPWQMDALFRDAAVTNIGRGLGLWELLAAALALGGAYFTSIYFLNRVVRRNALAVSARLRRDLHRHTFQLGGADVLRPSERNPVQLFTEEVEQVRRGLTAWWIDMPRAALLTVVLLLLAMIIHIWLALTTILLAILLFMLGSWLAGLASQRQQVLAGRAETQMSALVEGLKHSRLVTGYLLEDTPGAPFDEAMPRYLKHAGKQHALGALFCPLMCFATFAAVLLIVGAIGVNVLAVQSRLAPSDALVMSLALVCIYWPVSRLGRLRETSRRADDAAEAILEYMRLEPRVKELPEAPNLKRLAKQIELVDVVLHDASGRVLLENVSIAIKANCRTAVVSSDRSAMLAMACLFPRFYDADAGRVLYDGQDLRNVTIKSLRSQVTAVLQEGMLFTASVHDNIACGDYRISESDVREAAKLVGADEFIQRLPHGFSTTIGEHGIRLDPGESLLVGLTRAVVRNPSVIIVEEPSEDLDPAMALRIHHALDAASQQRTVISLATRLESLRTADHVFLLHEGRLHAEGTHSAMLQSNELYRHLIYLRYNEFRNQGTPQEETAQP